MDCISYLRRIGFVGRPRPDVDTLRLLRRGHLQCIPFENLDVQLGRSVTLDPESAFSKLVTNRRGGWRYEMNGLFLRVLELIGFHVLPLTGAVMRRERGPAAVGNHLLLSVQLDQSYIVDAPDAVRSLQAQYGQERVAHRLEQLFADTAAIIVGDGFDRLIVAGGETSGAVVGGLRLPAVTIGPEIDPGVPALATEGDKAVALALKSGNFGGVDFFAKALRTLSAA